MFIQYSILDNEQIRAKTQIMQQDSGKKVGKRKN